MSRINCDHFPHFLLTFGHMDSLRCDCNIQTMMNVYTHVTNSAKEKIADLFKNFMEF